MKVFKFDDDLYRFTNIIFNEISFKDKPMFGNNGNPKEIKRTPKWIKNLTIKKIKKEGKHETIGCEKIYFYKGKIFMIPMARSSSIFYVNTESVKKLAKYYKEKMGKFSYILKNINKFPKKWQKIIKQIKKEIKKC